MTVFKVVKAKVDLDLVNINLYLYYENTLADLNSMFKMYNKMVKMDNNLYNLKFYIGIINFKKIFNKFLIRFTFIIILLKFDDVNKILNFKRIIILRFWFKLVNKIKYVLFI